MGKIEKLIERLLSHPKDFTWDELVKILSHYGYEERKTSKTGGSRRKFINDTKNIISLHKPHPSNIVKTYALDIVIAQLRGNGKIR